MSLRFALAALAVLACLPQEISQTGRRIDDAVRPTVSQPARFRKAVVASVHELATDAGISILRKGGNAVDAAVAVGFALAVVHPEAGNLGGSGYALVRLPSGQVTAFDYIGAAPRRVAKGANTGYKSILVPGTVAGMGAMHARYGKLRWSDCLEPARKLARNGFPASHRLELILKLQAPVMRPFADSAKVFLHGSDRPLQQGEMVVQRDLAETIRRLQKRGPREFYEGKTAELIDAAMRAHDGFVTREDLREYRALETEPLRTTYRDHLVLTMSPSSSGGVALAAMLNVFAAFPMQVGTEGSAAVRHLQAEAMMRGFDARRRAIASNYKDVPVLASAGWAEAAARSIHRDRASPPRKGVEEEDSRDTTHFTVVDPAGMVVTNTYTLSGFFGSQVVIPGTGVLMNNHVPALFHPAMLKHLAPGRRYPSTMSPTLVLRPDGSLLMALGTPGANTIPSTLFQVISNVLDFRMSLRDAIEFPRMHCETGRVEAEPAALVFDVAERLRAMGHDIHPQLRSQGDVQAVLFELNGWINAWADGRRGGSVKGY